MKKDEIILELKKVITESINIKKEVYKDEIMVQLVFDDLSVDIDEAFDNYLRLETK